MIEVLTPGPSTTVQDLGRPGFAALAVSRSGAFDRGALRLANRLVGNPEGCAALETTLGGLVIRLGDAATVALTGAVCAGLDAGVAVTLPAGSVLRLGVPPQGLRSYLAVRGGVDVAPVLGSRSADTLSGLGPAPLRAGDRLPVGRVGPGVAAVSDALVPPVGGIVGTQPAQGVGAPDAGGLQARLGPRDDWFAHPAALFTTTWTVRADADRIGLRLDGPPLARRITRELPSEAARPGAVQVPPDGRPILFGPDAPVTGGYPVIAVLARGDLDRAAQLRPGDPVHISRLA